VSESAVSRSDLPGAISIGGADVALGHWLRADAPQRPARPDRARLRSPRASAQCQTVGRCWL